MVSMPASTGTSGSSIVSRTRSEDSSTRERSGLQGALQWKPDEQNEFNLTGVYIKGKYNNFSQAP